MTDDADCAVATKIDGHYFAVMFDDDTVDESLRTIGRWAASPDLPEFDWEQAAKFAAKIREVSCTGV